MAYTTVQNIQDRLQTTLTSEQASYFENVLLPGIEATINQETGTFFGSDDEASIYVDGTGTSTIIIPTMHSVTAVAVVKSDDTEEGVAVDTYHTYPRGSGEKYALRKLNGVWAEGLDNYKVTGKLGYTVVPEDITLVATDMAVAGLNTNVNGVKSEKVGDWSVTYGDVKSLSPESQAILSRYRRLSRSI